MFSSTQSAYMRIAPYICVYAYTLYRYAFMCMTLEVNMSLMPILLLLMLLLFVVAMSTQQRSLNFVPSFEWRSWIPCKNTSEQASKQSKRTNRMSDRPTNRPNDQARGSDNETHLTNKQATHIQTRMKFAHKAQARLTERVMMAEEKWNHSVSQSHSHSHKYGANRRYFDFAQYAPYAAHAYKYSLWNWHRPFAVHTSTQTLLSRSLRSA